MTSDRHQVVEAAAGEQGRHLGPGLGARASVGPDAAVVADHGALNRFSGGSGVCRSLARGLGGRCHGGASKGWFSNEAWGPSWLVLANACCLSASLLHGFSAGDGPIEDMLGRAIHDHVARFGIPVDLQGAAG